MTPDEFTHARAIAATLELYEQTEVARYIRLLLDENERLVAALRYIVHPTLGARTDADVRLALETCMRIARDALAGPERLPAFVVGLMDEPRVDLPPDPVIESEDI